MESGEIQQWEFEALKLRLADRTFYTPDFFVIDKDDMLIIYETKGYWEDDARVKWKVSIEKFPFKFVAVQRIKGEWIFEEA